MLGRSRGIGLSPGSLPLVLASTGRAILLTSLTTMLAFGSLVGSAYRGYVYFGAVMFAGVGFCFISSAIVLPSILALVYDRDRKTGVD